MLNEFGRGSGAVALCHVRFAGREAGVLVVGATERRDRK
jgi:hypothetical protein